MAMKDALFIIGLVLIVVGGCMLSIPWTMIGVGAMFIVFAVVAHLWQRPPRT